MKTKNNEVIYQIYPLTFNYAKGSASDPYKGCYGNLKGVSALVNYVSSLGVDAIWITPFYPFGGTGFGYDITDYCAVNPMFGTIDDFVDLCKVYHSKGIRVIIDQVYNHCSCKHPWFEKSVKRIKPYDEYFIWADALGFDDNGKPIAPNNWEPIWNSNGNSVWQWNNKRKQFYMHSFDYSMPNLNINNKDVQDELLKISKFWFDLGVDGFRLDAAVHYAPDPMLRDNPVFKIKTKKGLQDRLYDCQTIGGQNFLNRLKELCNSYENPKTLLAEFGYKATSKMAKKRVEDFFADCGVDAYFTGALNGGDVDDMRKHVAKDLSLMKNGVKLNWATSSHDVEREASRVFGKNPSILQKKMLLHFLLSLPGSICIFQGQELGLSNPKDFEKCKHPENDPLNIWTNFGMPWDAARAGFAMSDNVNDATRKMALMPDDEQYRLAVSNQKHETSLLNFFRTLVKQRKNSIFGEFGNVTFIKGIDNPEVIAFARTNEDKRKIFLLAYNFSSEDVSFVYRRKKYTVKAMRFIQDRLK
ncbi:MAG: hypothetical protein IKW58_00910 [Alphaproteobacteria bacterium]|nr:hypothetical protein [Alphaproteobacteria bacterium]